MSNQPVNVAVGRMLLDAMREEERTTGPHDPHPKYVEWLVWARNNAEGMLELIESMLGEGES